MGDGDHYTYEVNYGVNCMETSHNLMVKVYKTTASSIICLTVEIINQNLGIEKRPVLDINKVENTQKYIA